MKAFLLAAGNGTRLRPLTDRIPKCLVSLQGTKLLDIWLRWCATYDIDQVLLNSHAHRSLMQEYVDSDMTGVNITLRYEPELLGSAGTLRANREFVHGEREFAVLYADVLTNCRFDSMLRFHRLHAAPVTIGTYRVTNPSHCGIVVTDEAGRVVEFEEKPRFPSTDTAFSGILIAGQALFDCVPKELPADIGSDILPNLIGRMFGFPVGDYVSDIGTTEKYERAQREWPGL